MTLPDGGTAPAVSAARLAKGEETGIKIMELVEKQITARKVITESSIRNAIKACLAMSGSTNAVIHLTAIAHEAQIDMDVVSEFDSLSRTTPQLAKMNPACKYNIVDFLQGRRCSPADGEPADPAGYRRDDCDRPDAGGKYQDPSLPLSRHGTGEPYAGRFPSAIPAVWRFCGAIWRRIPA